MIKGEDIHGRFTVKRKYNEFLALRKIIAQRWPGSYIPGLKNKFDMKNDDQKSALLIKILVNFLTGLSYSKHIYYKE
jgi:sorting nexin-1/2